MLENRDIAFTWKLVGFQQSFKFKPPKFKISKIYFYLPCLKEELWQHNSRDFRRFWKLAPTPNRALSYSEEENQILKRIVCLCKTLIIGGS